MENKMKAFFSKYFFHRTLDGGGEVRVFFACIFFSKKHPFYLKIFTEKRQKTLFWVTKWFLTKNAKNISKINAQKKKSVLFYHKCPFFTNTFLSQNVPFCQFIMTSTLDSLAASSYYLYQASNE